MPLRRMTRYGRPGKAGSPGARTAQIGGSVRFARLEGPITLREQRHHGAEFPVAGYSLTRAQSVAGGLVAVGIAYVLRGRGGGRSGVRAALGTIGVDWRPGSKPRP